jgi:hypothetical protein
MGRNFQNAPIQLLPGTPQADESIKEDIMYCQNCGKEIKKGSKVCRYCAAKVKEAVTVKDQHLLRPLTPNQKATLAAIRKYEEKRRLRLGAKGSFSKKHGKLLTNLGKAIPEKDRLHLKQTQAVERIKNIKIPMHIPLHLPPEIIKEIKKNNIKKLTLQKIEKGKKLKLFFTTEDGKTKDIATTTANAFSGHSAFAKNKKLPPVGFGVVKEDKESTLELLIPTTPTSLTSKTTKNQGDALYLRSKMMESDKNKTESTPATQDDGLNNMLSDLTTPGTVSNLLGLSQQRLDNVAWHDFSYYEYIRDPQVFDLLGPTPTHLQITQGLIDLLDGIDDPSVEVAELLGFVSHLYQEVERMLLLNLWHLQDIWGDWSGFWYFQNLDLLHEAYWAALLESGVLSDFYEIYFSLSPHYRERFPEMGRISYFNHLNMGFVIESGWKAGDPVLHQLVFEWFRLRVQIWNYFDNLITGGQDVERISKAVEEEMMPPFQVFTPNSWNLGLRLVYRQEWRPLGIQRGETVKTIPLGPKQVEKISTKITRRTKVSRTAESLKALESTTETSDTSKDSSEIVKEAAETNKWNAEAEAGLDLGFFKIGGGGGGSGESEEKTKRTSTHLTETMQKTASKLRSESKIVVSTESESSFEITTASEIQNPNDEIPITYVFSKLQRQYEILTRLAEVNSVVFIAEPIPLPHQVTKEWVKKYDWIIAKVLLDDSFRDALISISQELSLNDVPTDKIDLMMDSATTSLDKLADKSGYASLENIDVIQEAQRAYRESYKENLEKKRNRDLLDQKQQRLLQHIRENILHYCRAIWSQEDPEQRMLRYKKLDIRIPTVWQFIIEGNTDIPISGWSVSGLPPGVKGHFEPLVSNPDTVRPITELINPAGPIGYAGNYAIYYLKSDAEIYLEQQDNLFDMLHLMRNFYMDLETGEFLDPAIRVMKDPNSSSYIPPPDPIPAKQRKEMVEYVPEIRGKYEGLGEDEKDAFLKDGLLPEQRKELKAIADPREKKKFLKENSCFEDPDLYYEYLFRKEYSRRFLVDTNNLILDLEAGTGSALETFKKLHRYVDVLKAIEEKEKLALENDRRRKLINKKIYGDPDIDRVIVVCGSKKLASLVAGLEMGGPAE